MITKSTSRDDPPQVGTTSALKAQFGRLEIGEQIPQCRGEMRQFDPTVRLLRSIHREGMHRSEGDATGQSAPPRSVAESAPGGSIDQSGPRGSLDQSAPRGSTAEAAPRGSTASQAETVVKRMSEDAARKSRADVLREFGATSSYELATQQLAGSQQVGASQPLGASPQISNIIEKTPGSDATVLPREIVQAASLGGAKRPTLVNPDLGRRTTALDDDAQRQSIQNAVKSGGASQASASPATLSQAGMRQSALQHGVRQALGPQADVRQSLANRQSVAPQISVRQSLVSQAGDRQSLVPGVRQSVVSQQGVGEPSQSALSALQMQVGEFEISNTPQTELSNQTSMLQDFTPGMQPLNPNIKGVKPHVHALLGKAAKHVKQMSEMSPEELRKSKMSPTERAVEHLADRYSTRGLGADDAKRILSYVEKGVIPAEKASKAYIHNEGAAHRATELMKYEYREESPTYREKMSRLQNLVNPDLSQISTNSVTSAATSHGRNDEQRESGLLRSTIKQVHQERKQQSNNLNTFLSAGAQTHERFASADGNIDEAKQKAHDYTMSVVVKGLNTSPDRLVEQHTVKALKAGLTTSPAKSVAFGAKHSVREVDASVDLSKSIMGAASGKMSMMTAVDGRKKTELACKVDNWLQKLEGLDEEDTEHKALASSSSSFCSENGAEYSMHAETHRKTRMTQAMLNGRKTIDDDEIVVDDNSVVTSTNFPGMQTAGTNDKNRLKLANTVSSNIADVDKEGDFRVGNSVVNNIGAHLRQSKGENKLREMNWMQPQPLEVPFKEVLYDQDPKTGKLKTKKIYDDDNTREEEFKILTPKGKLSKPNRRTSPGRAYENQLMASLHEQAKVEKAFILSGGLKSRARGMSVDTIMEERDHKLDGGISQRIQKLKPDHAQKSADTYSVFDTDKGWVSNLRRMRPEKPSDRKRIGDVQNVPFEVPKKQPGLYEDDEAEKLILDQMETTGGKSADTQASGGDGKSGAGVRRKSSVSFDDDKLQIGKSTGASVYVAGPQTAGSRQQSLYQQFNEVQALRNAENDMMYAVRDLRQKQMDEGRDAREKDRQELKKKQDLAEKEKDIRYSRRVDEALEGVNWPQFAIAQSIEDWLDNFLMESSARNQRNEVLRKLLNLVRKIITEESVPRLKATMEGTATEAVALDPVIQAAMLEIVDRGQIRRAFSDGEKQPPPIDFQDPSITGVTRSIDFWAKYLIASKNQVKDAMWVALNDLGMHKPFLTEELKDVLGKLKGDADIVPIGQQLRNSMCERSMILTSLIPAGTEIHSPIPVRDPLFYEEDVLVKSEKDDKKDKKVKNKDGDLEFDADETINLMEHVSVTTHIGGVSHIELLRQRLNAEKELAAKEIEIKHKLQSEIRAEQEKMQNGPIKAGNLSKDLKLPLSTDEGTTLSGLQKKKAATVNSIQAGQQYFQDSSADPFIYGSPNFKKDLDRHREFIKFEMERVSHKQSLDLGIDDIAGDYYKGVALAALIGSEKKKLKKSHSARNLQKQQQAVARSQSMDPLQTVVDQEPRGSGMLTVGAMKTPEPTTGLQKTKSLDRLDFVSDNSDSDDLEGNMFSPRRLRFVNRFGLALVRHFKDERVNNFLMENQNEIENRIPDGNANILRNKGQPHRYSLHKLNEEELKIHHRTTPDQEFWDNAEKWAFLQRLFDSHLSGADVDTILWRFLKSKNDHSSAAQSLGTPLDEMESLYKEFQSASRSKASAALSQHVNAKKLRQRKASGNFSGRGSLGVGPNASGAPDVSGPLDTQKLQGLAAWLQGKREGQAAPKKINLSGKRMRNHHPFKDDDTRLEVRSPEPRRKDLELASRKTHKIVAKISAPLGSRSRHGVGVPMEFSEIWNRPALNMSTDVSDELKPKIGSLHEEKFREQKNADDIVRKLTHNTRQPGVIDIDDYHEQERLEMEKKAQKVLRPAEVLEKMKLELRNQRKDAESQKEQEGKSDSRSKSRSPALRQSSQKGSKKAGSMESGKKTAKSSTSSSSNSSEGGALPRHSSDSEGEHQELPLHSDESSDSTDSNDSSEYDPVILEEKHKITVQHAKKKRSDEHKFATTTKAINSKRFSQNIAKLEPDRYKAILLEAGVKDDCQHFLDFDDHALHDVSQDTIHRIHAASKKERRRRKKKMKAREDPQTGEAPLSSSSSSSSDSSLSDESKSAKNKRSSRRQIQKIILNANDGYDPYEFVMKKGDRTKEVTEADHYQNNWNEAKDKNGLVLDVQWNIPRLPEEDDERDGITRRNLKNRFCKMDFNTWLNKELQSMKQPSLHEVEHKKQVADVGVFTLGGGHMIHHTATYSNLHKWLLHIWTVAATIDLKLRTKLGLASSMEGMDPNETASKLADLLGLTSGTAQTPTSASALGNTTRTDAKTDAKTVKSSQAPTDLNVPPLTTLASQPKDGSQPSQDASKKDESNKSPRTDRKETEGSTDSDESSLAGVGAASSDEEGHRKAYQRAFGERMKFCQRLFQGVKWQPHQHEVLVIERRLKLAEDVRDATGAPEKVNMDQLLAQLDQFLGQAQEPLNAVADSKTQLKSEISMLSQPPSAVNPQSAVSYTGVPASTHLEKVTEVIAQLQDNLEKIRQTQQNMGSRTQSASESRVGTQRDPPIASRSAEVPTQLLSANRNATETISMQFASANSSVGDHTDDLIATKLVDGGHIIRPVGAASVSDSQNTSSMSKQVPGMSQAPGVSLSEPGNPPAPDFKNATADPPVPDPDSAAADPNIEIETKIIDPSDGTLDSYASAISAQASATLARAQASTTLATVKENATGNQGLSESQAIKRPSAAMSVPPGVGNVGVGSVGISSPAFAQKRSSQASASQLLVASSQTLTRKSLTDAISNIQQSAGLGQSLARSQQSAGVSQQSVGLGSRRGSQKSDGISDSQQLVERKMKEAGIMDGEQLVQSLRMRALPTDE